jgi:hypothetical protein
MDRREEEGMSAADGFWIGVLFGALVAYGVGYYQGRARSMATRYGSAEITEAVYRVTGSGAAQIGAILGYLRARRGDGR